MLGKFESFYYNRNVHNGSWYGKSNFIPTPHLIWSIDPHISEKFFLIVFKNFNGGKKKFLFLYPHLEETLGPMPSKVNVVKFLQYIMTWYMNQSHGLSYDKVMFLSHQKVPKVTTASSYWKKGDLYWLEHSPLT